IPHFILFTTSAILQKYKFIKWKKSHSSLRNVIINRNIQIKRQCCTTENN
ncbi:hypothetical protein TNCT_339791, partial [Trichonephila clavata]